MASSSSCKCTEHIAFSKGQDSTLLKLKAKKVKVATQNYMKECGLLSKHASTVCQLCVDYTECNLINKKRKLENESSPFDSFIQQMNIMDEEHLQKVAIILGERISDSILNDADSLHGSYKDLENLTNFNVENWLNDRNKVLTSFLMSCAGCLATDNSKKKRCIAGSVDSLYKARHLNYIAPLPFSKNLLAYYLSGSKLVTQLNNRQQAAGSYSSLKRWLQLVSNKPIEYPKSGDLITFFDNSQTIARNWRVNYAHKTKASVITTLVHIQPNLPETLQVTPNLSPYQWLYNVDICPAEVVRRIEDAIADTENMYDGMRNSYIENRLKTVIRQTSITPEGFNDSVDDTVRGAYGPIQRETTDDPYAWIESSHIEPKPTIKVGEPAMENPCSYASVKAVLKHIQKQSEVDCQRAWTIAGCDGLPFVLGNRLILDDQNLQNILLMPGLGHIEMNAVKACFKLLWEPCFQDLAKMLGFRTARALMCCQLCSDNHKSWMILTVFLFATLDEILTTYVRHCLGSKRKPTLQYLYQYIGESKDKNFRFMCDVIFNTLLPLFMFRCGVRRNNHMFINVCQMKFMKLFYGFNMTFYQELMFYQMKVSVLAPVELKSFMKRTESFSCSGHPSKGEGGDFILESINAKIKKWLPPGIPTDKQWLEICRNLEKLHEIRQSTCESLGIKHDKSNVYQRDISTEVMQWRAKLRSSQYLTNNRAENMNHTSTDGQILDRGLLSFEVQCRGNLHKYLTGIANGSKPGKGLSLIPVFTTEAARNKFHAIENKTKAKISEIIIEGIEDIRRNGDVEEALVLEAQWQKIKVRTKNEMLQFYKEVVVALENSSAPNFDEDDDNVDDDDDDDETSEHDDGDGDDM